MNGMTDYSVAASWPESRWPTPAELLQWLNALPVAEAHEVLGRMLEHQERSVRCILRHGPVVPR